MPSVGAWSLGPGFVVIFCCSFLVRYNDADGRTESINSNLTASLPQSSANNSNSANVSITSKWPDDHMDLHDYSDEVMNNLTFPGEHNPTNYTHHNYDQLTSALRDLHAAYPQISRLYSMGKSLEGRDIWVLQIEAPATELPGPESRAEFKYVANMHGNEVVGRELLLSLARLLLHNYDKSQFVYKLMTTTSIHLVPSLNPDGYERSKMGCVYGHSQRGRTNGNNFDINRNFPDSKVNLTLDAAVQPEVRAMIEWSRAHAFVLSANLHGGALVVSYPFDGSTNTSAKNQYSASADDQLFKHLAHVYSFAHPTMHLKEMCYDNCTVYHEEIFTDGITNGAEWYSLYGGMQDWVYHNTGCLELTIEVGCYQYPPADRLYDYWSKNKLALLKYMLEVHRGIEGIIRDAHNKLPVANVTVHIVGKEHNVTSTKSGHFWRILLPGIYTVRFEAPHYVAQQVTLTVIDGSAQKLSIELKPGHHQQGNGKISSHIHGNQVDHSNTGISVFVIVIVLMVLVLIGYAFNRSRLASGHTDIHLEPTVIKYS